MLHTCEDVGILTFLAAPNFHPHAELPAEALYSLVPGWQGALYFYEFFGHGFVSLILSFAFFHAPAFVSPYASGIVEQNVILIIQYILPPVILSLWLSAIAYGCFCFTNSFAVMLSLLLNARRAAARYRGRG